MYELHIKYPPVSFFVFHMSPRTPDLKFTATFTGQTIPCWYPSRVKYQKKDPAAVGVFFTIFSHQWTK